MSDNYVDMAMDEVLDILLYNPDNIDVSTKKRVLSKMLEHYENIEEYGKCKHIVDLINLLEKPNESNNKKT